MNDTERRASPRLLLDRVMPEYEFAGRASVRFQGSASVMFRSLFEVTLADMPLAAALGTIRYLPGRLLHRTAVPPPTQAPFLQQLLASRNILLADDPGWELVIGSIGKFHQLLNQEQVSLSDAAAFANFTDPAYQKLVMSFHVEDSPHGRRFVLEHRTHALSAKAHRAFARYWIAIKPAGHFVSWLLLRAVRRRAEMFTWDSAPDPL